MPTFSAITLDMLLEPGSSKSANQSLPPMPSSNSGFLPKSKLERRKSTSLAERKVQRPQLKPSLYATPESTPLPDSPSSFPPSPYVINHKRRGPRLVKSFSEDDVSSRNKTLNEGNVNDNKLESEVGKVNEDARIACTSLDPIKHESMNGNHDYGGSDQSGSRSTNGELQKSIGEHEISKINGDFRGNGMEVSSDAGNDSLKLVTSSSERDRDDEDFFELHESTSFTSNTDGEDNGADHSGKLNTPAGEFFDAWEELSSEGGRQPSVCDIEGELHEMRLSLLMEIEKRKQAEETLSNRQSQWERFRQQLLSAGLTLHADSVFMEDGLQFNADHGNDLCQQVYLARFVSDSIGRGMARAEMDMEMEAQLDVKNFEIARLIDRLHYYEAVNHEMSQRNQESVEMARGKRLKRKRRQKWVWGAVAAAITVGTAALAWSYSPSGAKLSSSSTQHMDDSAN